MRYDWIKHEGGDKLTVFMLGWGADGNMLQDYTASDDSDLICFFDYHDTNFPEGLLQEIESYSHRQLIAWSFGVWAAEKVFAKVDFERATAINGTTLPVDEAYGISPRNFELTVRGIERAGNQKFIERMCTGRIGAYNLHPSQRSIEDISSELRTLAELFSTPYAENIRWDQAVIGGRDLIFPPGAQQKYWQSQGVPYTLVEDMPHYFR